MSAEEAFLAGAGFSAAALSLVVRALTFAGASVLVAWVAMGLFRQLAAEDAGAWEVFFGVGSILVLLVILGRLLA